MLIQQERYTLFPYTTLFRSRTSKVSVSHRAFHFPQSTTLSKLQRVTSGVSIRSLDRKSTRLNSSHANMSYAVFCLKQETDGGSAARHHDAQQRGGDREEAAR